MKKHTKMYTTAIAAALATSALVTVVPTQAETVTFKDVDSSNQFYEYITNLANRGIIHGYGDDTFRPGLEVRRDHAAKIIAGVLELNTTKVEDPKFTDVPANHPHYGEIAAIKAEGIISGDGFGKYLPEKVLTRGEMAKIIANAFDLEVPAGSTTPFTDVKGNMFEQYITALYVNGVTNGIGNNKFDPSGVVTREQLAAFVVRAEEIIAGEVVDKAVKVDSIDGDTIVVNGEVLILTEELKAVFNENNAAALKDAKVELVVRYKDAPVASLAPVANNRQGEVVGIKGVELPNADTKFNASGFNIPKVTVTAKGITISNVEVSTFTVAKDATVTLENVLADVVTAQGTLTLAEGTVVKELKAAGDAKITVAKGVKLEKVTLEEGKKLEDVIANYNEVKEQLKDVKVEEVKPTTPTTPGGIVGGEDTTSRSKAALAKADADVLVNNLVGKITSTPAIQTIGKLTTDNVYTFTFENKGATLSTIKSTIENSNPKLNLEQLLISSIPVEGTAITNILNITSVTVQNKDFTNKSITVNSPFNTTTKTGQTIGDKVEKEITENALAKHLTDLTGVTHDAAKTLTVLEFVDTKGDDYVLTVNFNDYSTLTYTIKLAYKN